MGEFDTKYWFGEEDLPEGLSDLTKRLHKRDDTAATRITDMTREVSKLKNDVNYIALILKGVLKTLESKGTINKPEFFQLLKKIDLEDGVRDTGIDPKKTLQ